MIPLRGAQLTHVTNSVAHLRTLTNTPTCTSYELRTNHGDTGSIPTAPLNRDTQVSSNSSYV